MRYPIEWYLWAVITVIYTTNVMLLTCASSSLASHTKFRGVEATEDGQQPFKLTIRMGSTPIGSTNFQPNHR